MGYDTKIDGKGIGNFNGNLYDEAIIGYAFVSKNRALYA